MILNNQKRREKRKGLEYRPHLIALSYFLNNIINNDDISLMPFFFGNFVTFSLILLFSRVFLCPE